MDDAFIARVLQRVAAAGPLRSFEHERASAIALWGATIAHHADRSAPVPAATTNGSPLAVATQHSSSSTVSRDASTRSLIPPLAASTSTLRSAVIAHASDAPLMSTNQETEIDSDILYCSEALSAAYSSSESSSSSSSSSFSSSSVRLFPSESPAALVTSSSQFSAPLPHSSLAGPPASGLSLAASEIQAKSALAAVPSTDANSGNGGNANTNSSTSFRIGGNSFSLVSSSPLLSSTASTMSSSSSARTLHPFEQRSSSPVNPHLTAQLAATFESADVVAVWSPAARSLFADVLSSDGKLPTGGIRHVNLPGGASLPLFSSATMAGAASLSSDVTSAFGSLPPGAATSAESVLLTAHVGSLDDSDSPLRFRSSAIFQSPQSLQSSTAFVRKRVHYASGVGDEDGGSGAARDSSVAALPPHHPSAPSSAFQAHHDSSSFATLQPPYRDLLNNGDFGQYVVDVHNVAVIEWMCAQMAHTHPGLYAAYQTGIHDLSAACESHANESQHMLNSISLFLPVNYEFTEQFIAWIHAQYDKTKVKLSQAFMTFFNMPQACATATAGAAFVPQSNWSFSPELQNDSSVFCSVADSDAFHATTALATASAAEEESLAVEHSASTYHVASNSPSAESIRETSFSDLCVLPSPISLSIPALTAEVTTRPRRASAARARTMMSEAVGGSCIVAADEDLENEDTDEADGEHDDDDSDVDMSGRKKKRRASGSSASSKRKRSRRSATADAPSSSREGKKPRQNFTKEARTLLKQWLAVHMSHPYPTEDEKEALAEECNLSMEQLGNWFVNARMRYVKR